MSPVSDLEFPGWHAGLCCHCLAPLDPSLSAPPPVMFCGEFCKMQAQYVRYVRRAIRDGRLQEPGGDFTALCMRDQQIAFLALDMAYVRPKLPPEVRAEVLAANDGLCVMCNIEPATEVDHIRGGSTERSNLQGLCRVCHELKPRGPIPDDLTRDGAGAVDEDPASDQIRRAWHRILAAPALYTEDTTDPDWCALRDLAQAHAGQRFADLTLDILAATPRTPAQAEEWSRSWGAYRRATTAWRRSLRPCP